MRRRDVMSGAMALAAATPALGLAVPGRGRVRPGDTGWPDEAAWAHLRDVVGGRLVKPTPVAAACATDADGEACRALRKDLKNPFYVGDQPGGTQVSGWLDAWSPKVSAWAVEARSAADVAAAVNFARTRNLRLVIKGGGHSYQGGSNAPDSLLVWTRAINEIAVHDAFTPRGAIGPVGPAVSVGAGAMWVDAYDAVTTKSGRYVQGGGCTTVGVAGLTLGGGFGSFSKRYGAACSSLLEAEIVTADGVVRTVNANRHPDLFWALKGGGQSAFGVVTRLTLRTHELADFAGGVSAEFAADSDEAYRRLLTAFAELCADRLVSPNWGETVHLHPDNRLRVSMVFLGMTADQAKAAWAPLAALANTPGSGVTLKNPLALALPMRRFWDFAAARKQGSPLLNFDDRPADDQDQRPEDQRQ